MDSNLTLDLLSDEAEHFEAVSVGDWSWLCPWSPSTIIWHMQCFALLQALRHWSKEWALTGPGNNRNKGTNDFVPTPAWCLPLSHHGLSAYWLHLAFSLSIFCLSFLYTHPHSNPPTLFIPPSLFPYVRQHKSFFVQGVPPRHCDWENDQQRHGPCYCRFQLQYIGYESLKTKCIESMQKMFVVVAEKHFTNMKVTSVM